MPELLPSHRSGPLAGQSAGHGPHLARGFAPVEVIVPASGRTTAAGLSLAAAPPVGRTEAGPPAPASAIVVPHLPGPPPIGIQRTAAPRAPAAPAPAKPRTPVVAAAAAASSGADVQRMISMVEQLTQRDLSTANASAAQEGGAMAQDPTAPVHYTAGGADKAVLNPEDLLANRQWFDELVDRVVRRMERHVVDELERRGRRYGNGAY
jgi:hypothetical protein